MRTIFSLFLILSTPVLTEAQNLAVDSVDHVLDNVVIQSDVFDHNIGEMAGSVAVVNPQLLARADGVSMPSVINAIPGVYMQSGALNTNRITIRGIGSRSPFGTNKIKAYLDEIPLSSGEGETTVEDINFATLGGMEVYRGPVSTIYGAGLGGAIHMITKKPDNQSRASLETSFGSYGLRRIQAGLELASKNKSLSLFYQDVTSDGYRENNEYDRQSITLMGKLLIGKSVLSTYLNYSHLKAFIPSSLGEEDYIGNPTIAASAWGNATGNEDNDRIRIGVSLNTEIDDQTESTVALFANSGTSSELRPAFLGNTGADFTNFGLRGNVKRNFLAADQLTLVLGTELFFENFTYQEFENVNSQNGSMTLDFFQKRNYGNVFLVSEYRPTEKWLLSLGSNFNWSVYDLQDDLGQGAENQSGEYKFDPIFSPKFSVMHFMTENISLYGQVSHGFSLPTFEETLYPEGIINQQLKPESGFNYELGLKGSAFENRLVFEMAAYSMRVKDLIVNRVIDEVPVGVNAGSATHNGLEFLLNHEMVKTDNLSLSHRLALTLMNYHFNDFVDGEDDYSGNEMTGVPNRTLDYSISGSTKFGLYGNINWQNVGAIPILDDNSIYADAYNLVNLKLGFQKAFGSFKFNIYGGINNVLDEKYASMLQINAFTGRYYYPGLPTNYYAGVKVAYQFK